MRKIDRYRERKSAILKISKERNNKRTVRKWTRSNDFCELIQTNSQHTPFSTESFVQCDNTIYVKTRKKTKKSVSFCV